MPCYFTVSVPRMVGWKVPYDSVSTEAKMRESKTPCEAAQWDYILVAPDDSVTAIYRQRRGG